MESDIFFKKAKADFIGIDIAKETCWACTSSSETYTSFINDPKKFAEFVKKLQKAKPKMVAMEATGKLERPLATALQEHNVPVVVLNPFNAKILMDAVGRKAKTDREDARCLASVAQKMNYEKTNIPSRDRQRLNQLVERRNDLIAMKTAEMNRLGMATDSFIKKSIDNVIVCLKKEIKDIDEEIQKALTECTEIQRTNEILMSIPEISSVTSAALLALLPELGQIGRMQIASLTGTAPLDNQSGKKEGKKYIGHGRRGIKEALFMPACSAIQHNPIIKKFRDKLLAKGKSKKMCLMACMRKLITIANQMIRNDQLWDADYETKKQEERKELLHNSTKQQSN